MYLFGGVMTPPYGWLDSARLIHKFRNAPLVGGHGVGGGGDGTAHHDVVRADGLGGGGGHDPLLVAHIPVGEAASRRGVGDAAPLRETTKRR